MSASAIEPRPPEIRIPKVPSLINNYAIFLAQRLASSNAAFRVSDPVVDTITRSFSPNAAAFIAGYLVQLGVVELHGSPHLRTMSLCFWTECDKQTDYRGRQGAIRVMLAAQAIAATTFTWRCTLLEKDDVDWKVWHEYDGVYQRLIDVLAHDVLRTTLWGRWRRSVAILNLQRQQRDAAMTKGTP